MKLKLILFSIIALFIYQQSYAQCCSAGGPDDGVGGESAGKNKLTVSAGYVYSFSDQYYLDNKPIDYKYIDESFFHYNFINVGYGITDKLSVSADLGYFFAKSQTFSFRSERNAFGLSDLSLSAVYKLYKTKKYYFSFTPTAKITIPIGQFDQIVDGVVLPIDLQPSAGNYKYNFGMIIGKKFNKKKFSISSVLSAEFSQKISTERTDYYKYGNLYNITMIGAYPLNDKLSLSMKARMQIRERASSVPGELINATGGELLFVSPEISYTFIEDWKIKGSFDYPVYKNLNGRQLSNKYMINLKLSKTFDLKKTKVETKSILGGAMQTFIKVHGTCMMCKNAIEKISNEFPGVIKAEWNLETKVLTLEHTNELNIEKLKRKLKKAGYEPL